MSADTLPSRRRLWLGVIAAPLAWLLSEGVGYVVASRICESISSTATASAMSRARVAHLAVCLICLLVALVGFATAISNLRTIRTVRAAHTGETRDLPHFGRSSFMSYGGAFASGVFTLGILLFATPGFVVNVCNQAR